MPTYNYYCSTCNKEFEAVHSITELLEDCPECKDNGLDSKKVKRLISSGGNFILQGSGWAKDRYG